MVGLNTNDQAYGLIPRINCLIFNILKTKCTLSFRGQLYSTARQRQWHWYPASRPSFRNTLMPLVILSVEKRQWLPKWLLNLGQFLDLRYFQKLARCIRFYRPLGFRVCSGLARHWLPCSHKVTNRAAFRKQYGSVVKHSLRGSPGRDWLFLQRNF